MGTPAIRVENLGKKYNLAHVTGDGWGYRTLRESLAGGVTALVNRVRTRSRATTEEFWALKDVSFEVQPGEVVGIIGRNGAGKSTLLKVLSRITKPTTGRAVINGRVGSLLEVGTGFHPELTGRENVYLNGSILGMSRREINRKFDEIVAFAEVEKFLDTPVKRYSSGMYVRLAFAVAAHLEPEILIVDEVLAVGDAAFQRKCGHRMGEVARGGRTVLLVSHDLMMVGKLSNQAIWLDRGEVRHIGRSGEVIDSYHATVSKELQRAAVVDLAKHPNRVARYVPLLRRLRLLDAAAEPCTAFPVGGHAIVEVECDRPTVSSEFFVSIDVCDATGTPIGQLGTRTHKVRRPMESLTGVFRCDIHPLMLLPGEYQINVRIADLEDYLDVILGAVQLTVLPNDYFGTGRLPHRKYGLAVIPGEWTVR